MPYIKNEIGKLADKVSDFGWESNSIEYDIDMLPDEDDAGFIAFLKQHDDEIKAGDNFPGEMELHKKAMKKFFANWSKDSK